MGGRDLWGEGVLDPGSRRQGQGTGILLLFSTGLHGRAKGPPLCVVRVGIVRLCVKQGALRGGLQSH